MFILRSMSFPHNKPRPKSQGWRICLPWLTIIKFIMCLREDRPFSNVHEKGIVSLLRATGGWEDRVDSAGSRLLEAARHHIVQYSGTC